MAINAYTHIYIYIFCPSLFRLRLRPARASVYLPPLWRRFLSKAMSGGHFDAFTRGRIVGLAEAEGPSDCTIGQEDEQQTPEAGCNREDRLRKKLENGAPAGIKKRQDFIARLRGAVRWLNSSGILLKMCHSMRERARDVLLKKGGRTGW